MRLYFQGVRRVNGGSYSAGGLRRALGGGVVRGGGRGWSALSPPLASGGSPSGRERAWFDGYEPPKMILLTYFINETLTTDCFESQEPSEHREINQQGLLLAALVTAEPCNQLLFPQGRVETPKQPSTAAERPI